MNTLVFAVLTFLAMGFGHYVPWHLVSSLVNKRGELHRPFAYAYGVGIIFVAMWWMAQQQPELIPAIKPLAWIIVAAGGGTIFPRIIGDLLEKKAQEGDLSEGSASLAGDE